MLRVFALATYQFPEQPWDALPRFTSWSETLALFVMVVVVMALPIMLPSFLFNVLTAIIFLHVLSGKKKLVLKDLV